MISYDNYLNRIQKLAKFKNFVHKFRFLFIGLFALIIAATTGLLVAKGTVTTAMTLPAQITFGESYSPTPASAFLSSVSYEYSLEGSGEWSTEKPVKAGKYLARTVTKKTVGYAYSEPVRFEIIPRDAVFSIGSDSVIYGEVPEKCTLSELVYGQRLVTEELRFDYASYVDKKTQVDVVESTVKITDASGEDFTSCYNITFIGKELEILPRAITLQADRVELTYSDSEATIANSVDLKSLAQLAYGDTITVQNGAVDMYGASIPAPKDKGRYGIEVKSFTVMKGDIDVTHHYDVKKLVAELIINARTITVTTGSAEKVYDGKYLQADSYTYAPEELIPGHSISALYDYLRLTDAGTVENANSFVILNSFGTDISENYDIKKVYGKLSVLKRAITVHTASDGKEYDGTEFFNSDYSVTIGSIADGQTAIISNYVIRNVWESGENRLALSVWDNGIQVTHNYEITYDYGTLTISKRDIAIATGSATKIYDGEPLDNTEITPDNKLVTGHRIEAANTVSITNAGSVGNEIIFVIYSGFDNVTENYNIIPRYGSLTVEKRPISVTTGTKTFVFDGVPHSYGSYETRYYGEDKRGLVSEADKLVLSNLTEIREVGETENRFDVADESGNYDIKEVTYNKLYVTARPIRVVMGDATKEYDGTPLTNSSYITNLSGAENVFGLVEGDVLVLSGTLSEITNVGTAENKCPYTVPNDNYKIVDVVKGELRVYERAITVELLDVEVIYGGEIKYPAGKGNIANAESCNLAYGEEIEVFVIFGIGDGLNGVGTYVIRADAGKTLITNAKGEKTTFNYAITYKTATLTVISHEITIKTVDNFKTYDGTPLENNGYSSVGILSAHEIYVMEPYSITNVDESGLDKAIFGIRDKITKQDVTGNYEINYEYGYLVITARPITVITASDSKVYDGTPLENTNYETRYFGVSSAKGLLNEDKLILVRSTTISNVGDGNGIKNECEYQVPNSNYEIKSYEYGTLTVTKRYIIVNTGSAEKVFDNTPLTCEDYTTDYYLTKGDSNGNKAGLIGNDKLTLKGVLASITDVGEKVNSNMYESNSNYYVYGYRQGKLTVTVREIIVVTGSNEKEYDGLPLSCTEYSTYLSGDKAQNGLCGNDALSLKKIATRINAGQAENTCEYEVPNGNYSIAGYDYGTLTVTPKAIIVEISEVESVTYGDTFNYPKGKGNFKNASTCGLVNGEAMEIGVYYLENGVRVTPKNAGQYEVALDIETTKVYGADGREIEQGVNNYFIAVETATAEIRQREVKIIYTSASEITYGDAYKPEYYFAKPGDVFNQPVELPYGEQIVLGGFVYATEQKVWNIPKHVGTYEILATDNRVYLNGVEVEGGIANYNVWIRSYGNTVTVTPKEITVGMLDMLSVYGDAFEYPSYAGNYEGEYQTLPYGDEITVFAKPVEELLPVGIHYGYIQADGERTLVNGVTDTSDYKITYVNGDLEVVKRSIIVINKGAEKVYDGTPLSNGEYTTRTAGSSSAGLIGDDTLTLTGELVSITNVWESGTPNANRYNANENYDILSYEDGELIITPKAITVEISEIESVTYGESFNYPTGKGNFKNVDRCGLAEGEELEIAVIYYKLGYVDDMPEVIGWYEEDGTPIEQPKNAGTYKVALDIQRTKIYKGGDELEDGLSNYFIAVETATLKILPKTVTLTFEFSTITYGEGEDFVPEYNFDVAPEDMPYGEKIIFDIRYYKDGNYFDVPVHVGAYQISLFGGAHTVYTENGDEIENGIDNYSVFITTNHATVTVNPKEITVEILDIEGIEYGEGYSYPVYEGNYKNRDTLNLPYGDVLTLFDSGYRNEMILSVGTHYWEVNVDETKTLVNGIADTSDYIITYISGNLEIVPRQIIITNPGAQKVYDGVALSNGEYTTRSANYPAKAGLLYGDGLILVGDELISIINVSESGTLNANRYTASYNYEIVDYEDEPLEIIARKIVIATDSGEWEYDGLYHSLDSFNEDESYHYNEETGEKEPALISDHYFVALTPAKIKDVGTIRNVSLGDNEIYDGEGNLVTDNYEMDIEKTGYLTITPRTIVIRTRSADKIYDGTPLSCEDYATYYYTGEGYYNDEESEIGLIEGDELALIGEPIFATYVWEYRVININSYQIPVGEYGNPNYTVHHYIYGYLEINPREITVEIGDIIHEYDCGPGLKYGVDNYENYLECDLAEGEKLHIEVIHTDAEGNIIPSHPYETRFHVGTYGMLLDTEYCVIYKDGEVFERGIENYNISCDGSTLTIIPRKLTVTQNDIEAIYGDEIVYNGYQGGDRLPYCYGVQDELTFDYGYYFKDEDGELVPISEKVRVGTYVIHVDEDSVRVNGGAPTDYDFTFIDGTLTIIQREVEVTLKSIDTVYGEEFSYPTGEGNYESAITLAYDDTLELFVKILSGDRPDAGEYLIVIDEEKSPLVNGEEDTSDYIFTFIEGTLSVATRGITLKLNPPDRSYTYGEIYSYEAGIGNYEFAYNLAYNELLEVVVKYRLDGSYFNEPKNVGAYDIVLNNIVIYDEFGTMLENGEHNYYIENIDSVAVQLTVVPREVTVTIENSEYVYGFEAPEIDYSPKVLEFDEVLIPEFYYTQGAYVVTPEDAGEYRISVIPYKVRIDGLQYLVENKNYTLSFVDATLTIHARKIVVETNTSSHVYDGEYYSDSFVKSHYYADENIEGFVFGYQPQIVGEVPSIKNVGEIGNVFEFVVSSNYEITGEISYGTISVTERDLVVVINSYGIIYGEEYGYPEGAGNYYGVEGLVDGEELEIFVTFNINKAVPDVGRYEINADESATRIYGGEKQNYSISFIKGWLTVSVRTIVITTASGTWVYDGKAHSAKDGNPEDSYYINSYGEHIRPALVEGHVFEAGEYPEITNVGTVLNNCYGGNIFDENGGTVTYNYYIDLDNSGTLTVTPRGIEVTSGSAEKEYDGTELYANSAEVTYGEIVEGQSFEVTEYPAIKNVLQSAEGNNTVKITIYGADGENVTDNYYITYISGTLTVTPRKIVVKTADDEKVYDATPLRKASDYSTYHFGNPEEDGLLNGDTLILVSSVSITDFGSIENACTYRPNSSNYKIMEEYYEYGTLTITKRHITVETLGKTKMYDGTPLFETGYKTYLTDDASKAGLLGGDRLVLDAESIVYVTQVGESSQNTLVLTVESENYEIDGFVYGYLEITQRRIIVITATDSKTYDGTPLENYTDYTVILDGEDGEGLLEGDALTVTKWTSVTNVVRKPTGEVGSADNICFFTVPNDNYYMVEIRCGTLTIYPAPLKVVLFDVESVAYGQNLYYPTGEGNYVSADGLVNYETLEVVVYYTTKEGAIILPVNAGEYGVQIDLENSLVSGTKGLNNYEVEYGYKTAVIEKLTLNVELSDSVEYEYDSTAHGYDLYGYTIVGGGTVEGETLVIAVKYYDESGRVLYDSPSDAGKYTVELDKENCLILKGYIPSSANINYDLQCDSKLDYIITPARFYVTMDSAQGMYTGSAFNFTHSGGFNYYGLYGSDSLECNVKYYLDGEEVSPVNAKTYEVRFDTENIRFTNGKASNYVFDDTQGNFVCELVIIPRPILVTVNDREIEYTVKVNPADESYKATLRRSMSSGAAFVGDDEQNAQPEYYYNGSTDIPSGLGTYEITVKFLNEEVMSNYEVTYAPGTLTIVGRKVLVTPVYTGGVIEYNGYAVNTKELEEAGKLGFTHIHDIADAAEDDRFGFAPEDLQNLTVIYEFLEAFTGKPYTGGATPKNAGYYYISIVVTGYDESKYSVVTESTIDFLIISKKDVRVTSISSAEKLYDKKAPEDIQIVYSGICDTDEETCTVFPRYLDASGAEITAFNVGTYTIEAKIADKNGADNYNIIYADNARGTLTITPVTLYIRPISIAEYYQGRNLVLGIHDYEFVDSEHSGLVEGDELRIVPSASLTPSKTYTSVLIASCSVYSDGEDITSKGNYLIYYAYDRNIMGTGYSSGDFKGSLEYLIRTVHYKQIISEDERIFAYDGEVKEITSAGFEIVSGKGEGLFGSNQIRITSAKVGPQVGQYDNWLKLNVYDTVNRIDVSKVYNLVLDNAAESSVTIEVLEITIRIKSTLTVDVLERGGDVFFTASLFDGRKALEKHFYEVVGIMTGLKHEYEIIAIKSHGVWNLAAVIYEVKASGSLTDRSDSYRVTFVKEDGLNVECTVVECHSLTNIKSDINLEIKLSYEELLSGEGMSIYDNRPALSPSQYEMTGLLPGHVVSQIVVIRSNGCLTFTVLITNGRSDRSYYYNLVYGLPEGYPGEEVRAVLASSVTDVRQDVTVSVTASLQDIMAGAGLEETYDGRLALSGSYTVEGLLPRHVAQIIPVMSGGKVTLAVLIFEARLSGDKMIGRSDRSYYYNLLVKEAPTGAVVVLVSSPDDILADLTITLNGQVTAQNLKNGVGIISSAVDGRRVLSADMYTVENCFGRSPLASNHTVEIIVDFEGDSVNLYVIVYQLSVSGKRTDRSYYYSLNCECADENINVIYQPLPLGNEGLN